MSQEFPTRDQAIAEIQRLRGEVNALHEELTIEEERRRRCQLQISTASRRAIESQLALCRLQNRNVLTILPTPKIHPRSDGASAPSYDPGFSTWC